MQSKIHVENNKVDETSSIKGHLDINYTKGKAVQPVAITFGTRVSIENVTITTWNPLGWARKKQEEKGEEKKEDENAKKEKDELKQKGKEELKENLKGLDMQAPEMPKPPTGCGEYMRKMCPCFSGAMDEAEKVKNSQVGQALGDGAKVVKDGSKQVAGGIKDGANSVYDLKDTDLTKLKDKAMDMKEIKEQEEEAKKDHFVMTNKKGWDYPTTKTHKLDIGTLSAVINTQIDTNGINRIPMNINLQGMYLPASFSYKIKDTSIKFGYGIHHNDFMNGAHFLPINVKSNIPPAYANQTALAKSFNTGGKVTHLIETS
jgi:hypothetical protein